MRDRLSVPLAAALAVLSVFAACAPATAPAAAPTAAQAAAPAAAPEPTPGSSAVRHREGVEVVTSSRVYAVVVYASHSLAERHADVRRAIVVVHGDARNADDYFDYAARAVGAEPHVAIIAPHFATASDAPAQRLLAWSDEGWKQGDESRSEGARVSSFVVLNRLIDRLDEAFPDLDAVVVVGHSAGGQFVQRYAATTGDPRLTFVVANPSSYMYLGNERPTTDGRFAVPEVRCAYDEYKYGLHDLNAYLDSIGAETLWTRYRDARVVYLLGEDDRDTRDEDLDQSCAANAQGADRFARGLAFHASLGRVYGPGVYERHQLVVVPGVGHSARDMLASRAAIDALLGRTP